MSRGRVLMRDMRRPIASRQVDFGCLSVSVPLSRLRRQAEALYGPGAADAGLSFGLIADLRTPRGRHLHDTIHFVADQLNGAAGAIDRLTAAAWEDLLLTQMLSALPNSLEDVAGQAPRSGALPYHVKRARDFIHDHAQDRIASADLARAAGCSLRTLQGAFAETIGLSPMGYLKAVRLERAHGDLRAARASCHRGRDRAPLGLRAAGPFRPRLSAALRLHPDRDSAQRRLRRRVGRCGARGSRLSECARSVRKAQETVRSAASALPAGPTLVQCQRIIVGSDMGW